jgi:hypothetical protein
MDTCELLCGGIQTPVHTTMQGQYLRVFKFYLYIEIIVVAQLVEALRCNLEGCSFDS